MKLTIAVLLSLAAFAEEKKDPTPPPLKAMTAEQALRFVEAAAIRFQASDSRRQKELELEPYKQAEQTADAKFAELLTELRKASGVAPDCNPQGTGDKDPAKRYVWRCAEPPP